MRKYKVMAIASKTRMTAILNALLPRMLRGFSAFDACCSGIYFWSLDDSCGQDTIARDRPQSFLTETAIKNSPKHARWRSPSDPARGDVESRGRITLMRGLARALCLTLALERTPHESGPVARQIPHDQAEGRSRHPKTGRRTEGRQDVVPQHSAVIWPKRNSWPPDSGKSAYPPAACRVQPPAPSAVGAK